MPDKDPSSYSLLTYLSVVALAVVGGAVNLMRRLNSHVWPNFNFMEIIGELTTSGFAGVMTFWLCEAADINGLITAVLIGISGHMGGRAIFIIEKWAEHKFGGMK